MLAVLYDVHGNLPALDAVLAETGAAGANRYLLGGDYCVPSPWPTETLERLRALPDATWIRGNGERWLREPPDDRPDVARMFAAFSGQVSPEDEQWLYTLPTDAELDGILFVHGSPLSDVESFAPQAEEGEVRLLAGVRDRTVVFGHSHLQFTRPGPSGTTLVNPGSVGMPLDGDPSAAWALWDGAFEFRRTEYDRERAKAGYATMGAFGELVVGRIERGRD